MQSYQIASKLAEIIIRRLFRGIAKQDIGGCEASTLITRGITIIWRHCVSEFGGMAGSLDSQQNHEHHVWTCPEGLLSGECYTPSRLQTEHEVLYTNLLVSRPPKAD